MESLGEPQGALWSGLSASCAGVCHELLAGTPQGPQMCPGQGWEREGSTHSGLPQVGRGVSLCELGALRAPLLFSSLSPPPAPAAAPDPSRGLCVSAATPWTQHWGF